VRLQAYIENADLTDDFRHNLLDPFVRTKDSFLLDECRLDKVVELLRLTNDIDKANKAWNTALEGQKKAVYRSRTNPKGFAHYIENRLKRLREAHSQASLSTSVSAVACNDPPAKGVSMGDRSRACATSGGGTVLGGSDLDSTCLGPTPVPPVVLDTTSNATQFDQAAAAQSEGADPDDPGTVEMVTWLGDILAVDTADAAQIEGPNPDDPATAAMVIDVAQFPSSHSRDPGR